MNVAKFWYFEIFDPRKLSTNQLTNVFIFAGQQRDYKRVFFGESLAKYI